MTMKQVYEEAKILGIHVMSNRPGDGTRRYEFGRETKEGGYYTVFCANGAGEARCFLRGFALGKAMKTFEESERIRSLLSAVSAHDAALGRDGLD